MLLIEWLLIIFGISTIKKAKKYLKKKVKYQVLLNINGTLHLNQMK